MKTIKASPDLVESDGKWSQIELHGFDADEGIVISICGDICPDADIWNYDYEITLKPIKRR